jgi:hypothetical protein
MTNFQIFALFCCQSHWWTPRPPTNHSFMCDVMSSCYIKPKKWHSMEIESNSIGPLSASHIWKHIHCAFRYMASLNTYWTPPEHLWVHVNANEWVGTAPKNPLSVHECQWVSGSSPWTPHLWVIIERDWPCCDHEKVLVHVRTEHTPNACECMWVPMSEYWTPPVCLWVCVNGNEWVGTSPEHPLSVHECLWESIW